VDSTGSVATGPSVPSSGTMRDALAALLDGGQGWVLVRDEAGAPLGVLTPTEIALTATADIPA
jgi:CBS domain containing-hemolysin-like protein